ncbi:Peptidase family M48 [Mycobacterium marinum]|uniref:M56 family metallopeptidase n=1 Tax=Mycobacterium marinum TaxID=1781 RepID=UPI000E3BD492|nr:M56 family metallopeptidase [Mycobacterium marinum]RFZ08695.1 Peptidase family M48 [Mycobacterium marinum]
MSVAVCLLLYSFAVAMLSPWVLLRLTRAGTLPRLGVVAWLAAMVSVVGSRMTAAALLIVSLTGYWGQPDRLTRACLAALRRQVDSGSGAVVQAGLFTVAAAAASALGILSWRLSRSLWRARAHSRAHAESARVIGRRIAGVDAVVVDAPVRAAYCVAGRPDTIVVTSAALDVLTDRHLEAVLAHERAHLAGRHHHVLAITRALAAAVPHVTLFSKGAREIARLLEISADDAAARSHGSQTLLDALLALSTGGPTPHGAVGATGTDVLARAERLAAPFAARTQWTTGLLLTATTLLIAGGPLIPAALNAAGAMWCYPVGA